MGEETISWELRAVEREVDDYYKLNALTADPFSQAAWYFLAFCEDKHLFTYLPGKETSDLDQAALVDNLIVHAQWPLKWLMRACPPGGKTPRSYHESAYTAARELSELAMRYRNFVAGFTWASWGRATLTLEGRVIKGGLTDSDTRFEAYDRLLGHHAPSMILNSVDLSFSGRICASVRVRGDWFDYELTPQVVLAGVEAFSPFIDLRFDLPGDWRFPRFSLIEFRKVARVLWVLAFVHFQARLCAADMGCKGLGYSRALLLFGKDELFRRLRRYSGVPEEPLSAILQLLSYGSEDQFSPDPALQPLIPLSPSVFAISPSLLLNSSMERNLAVLLNRIPEAKTAYSALSTAKEIALRDRLVSELSNLGFRFWHGNVPEWGTSSQIDLVIISDEERQCLVLELKSFIAPAEPREVRERSEEIQKGVTQICDRMKQAQVLLKPLLKSLTVVEGYGFGWAVASETSIGAAYVQKAEVPVVNVQHLVARLKQFPRLPACCRWLSEREYLPIEGVDYESVPTQETIGGWTLEWYGIKGITEGFVNHDRSASN